jgi:hypothetical protein
LRIHHVQSVQAVVLTPFFLSLPCYLCQVAALLTADLVPPLLQMMRIEVFDVQKEVAWTLCNMILSGTMEQVRFMSKHGVTEALVPMLESPDIPLLLVLLEAFESLLHLGAKDADETSLPTENAIEAALRLNGQDLLERLQSHENTDVYRAAENILKHFFPDEDVEEEENEEAEEEPKKSDDAPTGNVLFSFGPSSSMT